MVVGYACGARAGTGAEGDAGCGGVRVRYACGGWREEGRSERETTDFSDYTDGGL